MYKGVPLIIGKTNDYGIAIQYPRKLIAYGYDIHGYDSNGWLLKLIIALCVVRN